MKGAAGRMTEEELAGAKRSREVAPWARRERRRRA